MHDFADLRSAIKYWLESLGYRVLISEFNDFSKPLDENSFTACLHAIQQCDYFILLIGRRVGGYYDQSQKISITRQEYRHAYEQVRKRRLKIITLVREDVWTVHEDRKSLEKLLQSDYADRLEDTDVNRIAKHSSTFINDAGLIIDFIAEVARAGEMRDAARGKGDRPIGNWIHTFSSFKDVVDVLEVAFQTTDTLSRRAISANLRVELLTNLQVLLFKHEETVIPSFILASDARDRARGTSKAETILTTDALRTLAMFCFLGAGSSNRLSTRCTEWAINSGEFLDYDSEAGGYIPGKLLEALGRLRSGIERLRSAEELFKAQQAALVHRWLEQAKAARSIAVPNMDLLLPLTIFDAQRLVTSLSAAIVCALDGDPTRLDAIPPIPALPFEDEAEQLSAETPTLEELADWCHSRR